MNTKLLACKVISDQARQELKRAGCTIHKEVPGLDDDIEIVELRHDGEKDLNVMSIRDVPREIEISLKTCICCIHMTSRLKGMS